jgi:hypothetical protein
VKRSILRRRPSPALVISMIALFVSLSGVSYGVATGFIDSREIKNNEIRSRDIRNNEVRTRDLRNNEIRGIDIRNSTVQGRDLALNTVTGEDVREDTLGKVPSATSADSATSATTAGGVSTLKIIPRTTIAEGAPPVTLATHGPLTLSGTCEPDMTNTHTQLRVQTTEDNSAAWAGTAGMSDTPQPVLDAGDGPQPITSANDAAGGTRTIGSRAVAASAPSGKAFTGQVALLVDASGASSCTFHGHLALQG